MRAAAPQALAAGAFERGGEREGIGQFERRGQEAGGQDGVQRADGVAHGAKTNREAGAIRRQRQQLQGGLSDNAQQPLGADKQPVQLEAGLVFVRAPAQSQHSAVREDHLQAEHVIAGDAVLEAARAAGVGDDVAANRIVRPAGRVRRIEEPQLFDCLLELLRINAGLNHRHKVGGVDFLDPVHARQRKHDAAADGHAAADVAMSRATRGDRDFVAVGKAQDGRNGLGAARQHHHVGRVRGEPLVAGVFGQNRGGETDLARRQHSLSVGQGA